MTSSKFLLSYMLDYMYFLGKIVYIWPLSQLFGAISQELSERQSPELESSGRPWIKLNLALTLCVFVFFSQQFWQPWRIQSRLLSFNWTLQRSRSLVPARVPCAHPPPWCVQMNWVNISCGLESPILADILSLIQLLLNSLIWGLGFPWT